MGLMMNENEISSEITKAISNVSSKCTCFLWYGEYESEECVGTGTLVKHKNEYYILTCEHVATEFFTSKNAIIVFGNAEYLNSTEVKYFRKSKRDDLALLRLKDSKKLENLSPKTIDDFAFKDLDTNHEALYYLCGFPAEEVKASQNKRNFMGLTTFTVAIRKMCTKNKLFLEYEENETNYPLASPKGYSGSLIFEYINPSSAQKKGKIWYPTLGKAVSIQYKSDMSTYIVGTTIKILKKWLAI